MSEDKHAEVTREDYKNLYLAAVRGRRELRQALKECRDELRQAKRRADAAAFIADLPDTGD